MDNHHFGYDTVTIYILLFQVKTPDCTGSKQPFLLSFISLTMNRGNNPRRFIVDWTREQENDPIDATHSRGVLAQTVIWRPRRE